MEKSWKFAYIQATQYKTPFILIPNFERNSKKVSIIDVIYLYQ